MSAVTMFHVDPSGSASREESRAARELALSQLTGIVNLARNAPGVLPAMDSTTGRSLEAGQWAHMQGRASQIRQGMVTDAAEIEAVVSYADRAWHNRLRLFAYGVASAGLMGQDALEAGRIAVGRGWRQHGKLVSDASTAASAYPGLIAQMAIRELQPLPTPNFEQCFPTVAPAENLMPGITHYQKVRGGGRGRPGIIANGQNSDFNTFDLGIDTELAWTAFYGGVLAQHYIRELQSALPGQPTFGMDDVLMEYRAAMAAAGNRIQWAGAGPGKLGFLDLPEVQYQDQGTLPSDVLTLVNAVVDAIGVMRQATKGLFQSNLMILSEFMAAKMNRPMSDGAGGLIAETGLSFLRAKVLQEYGISRVVIAHELDNLRAPTATTTDIDTDSNYTGVWVGSDEAVQRVEILPTTMLPVVNGLFVQSVPVIAQVGQPYHNSSRPSVMIRWAKT